MVRPLLTWHGRPNDAIGTRRTFPMFHSKVACYKRIRSPVKEACGEPVMSSQKERLPFAQYSVVVRERAPTKTVQYVFLSFLVEVKSVLTKVVFPSNGRNERVVESATPRNSTEPPLKSPGTSFVGKSRRLDRLSTFSPVCSLNLRDLIRSAPFKSRLQG